MELGRPRSASHRIKLFIGRRMLVKAKRSFFPLINRSLFAL
jgi:hypothetical protein